MSMFEDNCYRWRETYFVLFRSSRRPKLKKVQQMLSGLNDHYELKNLSADEQGRFESLTLVSPDDFAAIDICYTDGAEVLEQGASLAQEIKPASPEEVDRDALRRLVQCDARFDMLHFEQLAESPEDEDDSEEMLDPSALLLVLAALAKMTDGIAVDPQAGTILTTDE
jgi:hypothetical protein